MTRQEKNKNLYDENKSVCLMCGEELQAINYNNTYIYKHKKDNACPFIGFEYIEEKDLNNLVEYIKRG